MATSELEKAAEEYCQLYYYNGDGSRVSAGPNPVKEVAFVEGAKWLLSQLPRLSKKESDNDLIERVKQLTGRE